MSWNSSWKVAVIMYLLVYLSLSCTTHGMIYIINMGVNTDGLHRKLGRSQTINVRRKPGGPDTTHF